METQVSTQSLLSAGKAGRIQVVDALRGFALFGILLVHTTVWFDGGPLPGSVYQINEQGAVNMVTQTIIGIFFSGKFYTFFAFLFGLSFALMLTRSTESDGAFLKRFVWRLLILGAIGLLHSMHWRGDILSIYAMLGFVMLLFRNASPRLTLIVALLLILNVPIRITDSYRAFVETPPNKAQVDRQQKANDAQIAANYDVIKHGSYLAMLPVNLREFRTKMDFQFDSGRIYITLGFFLLGLYAGRKRLFQRLPEANPVFRRLTRYTGFLVLGIILLFLVAILMIGQQNQPPKVVELIFAGLFDLGNGAMTLFFITGLTLLFQRATWQRITSPLAAIGKMALTNYISQSIIGTLIFYGYGLGLIGELNIAQTSSLAIPIFLFQILFSRWWLARFQYGPLEWLWRSLTYGKAQPMRLRAVSSGLVQP